MKSRVVRTVVPLLPLLDVLCHVFNLPHPEGFGFALRDTLAARLEIE